MQNVGTDAFEHAIVSRPDRMRTALYGVIAAGILIRLAEYLYRRGLHGDEAKLHWNLVERSFAGLAEPLDRYQGAPILFLWLEKFLIETLGDSEYVFRMWPMMMGIGALALFGAWAWKNLEPLEALVATGVLALGRYPLLYSSFAKQYSTDLFIAVALYFLLHHLRKLPWRHPRYWGLVLCGIVIVWLSHPSVFVIAGAGGVLLLQAILRREADAVPRLGVFCALTAAAFAVEYFTLLRSLASNDFLLEWWEDGFMPFPPTSVSDLLWFWDRLITIPRIYTNTIALNAVFPLLLLGGVVLYRRDRWLFWGVMGPFVAVLIASAARQYPIHARLALFLYPMLAVLLGIGTLRAARAFARWIPAKAALAVVSLALFLPEAVWVARALTEKERSSDFRLILSEISERLETGDCFAIEDHVWPVFSYYREEFRWDDRTGCIVRFERWERDGRAELARLRQSDRVWFLFVVQHNEFRQIRPHVEANGRKLFEINKPYGIALLYEMTE